MLAYLFWDRPYDTVSAREYENAYCIFRNSQQAIAAGFPWQCLVSRLRPALAW